jgi:hypothetical protein
MSLPKITNYTKEEKEALFLTLVNDSEVKPILFKLIRANQKEMFKLPEFKDYVKKTIAECIEDRITCMSLIGITRRV